MDSQKQPGFFVDGLLVVSDAGAIRSPDFAQPRVRLPHDVGDAERSADLDQFAARDDDLAALAQSIQSQQHGRSVVINDNSRNLLNTLETGRRLP